MPRRSPTKPQVLYIVYWGAAEPLGQALVLPALQRLAELGAELTLVTFEKPTDLARADSMAQLRATLAAQGIRWVPLRYHKRPKVPATAGDILQGCARAIVERLHKRPDIIHARTFIGGLIGMTVAPLLGAKFIYHAEGFYPDEEVDNGVWQAGSAPHRVAKFLEQQLYARADGIIVLSERARRIVADLPAVARRNTPVTVVPSCVNLTRFGCHLPPAPAPGETLRLVYSGNVGKRYILDQVGRFVAVAAQMERVHFRILTRVEPDLVASMLSGSGLPQQLWSMASVSYEAMPEELARQHVGLHFLRQGLAEHGGSPTKIGEYWAAGLPVVVTPNAGDTDEIIRRERVGVIVREHSEAEYRRAFGELQSLLADHALADRCRRVAETYYALGPACERQWGLYQSLRASAPAARIAPESI